MQRMPGYIFLTLLSLLILSIAGNVYYFLKVRTLENPQLAAQEEVQSLVRTVGKLIVLPTDDTPTIATVSDPSKLRDQAFFNNAQVGDKVLIYQRARKAVLWRPSTSQVIEVSGLNVTAPQTGPTQ